ncbi:DUF192 domain-containing protein [Candidatus Methylacidiphilum infernorum]|uniref:DUF192 domain-containing protein n=1 Tax=Candidatus Methylacidiphilum infernorum TaxID=511746 RepID=A0ABX7PUJ0_9BACT|nr:DUF192 domain-containing protein [Candidatus Methylacidiphilum infernorum]QSR86328.1 DUF192 domain-containing protein [Candidatus Methylacidiphilum infernorum]
MRMGKKKRGWADSCILWMISILFFPPLKIKGEEKVDTVILVGKLPTQHLTAEVVWKNEDLRRGLMYRERLPEDNGMLFVLPYEQKAVFWMKNTRIPLSIAFMNREGRILEIYSMKPFDLTPVPSRSSAVKFALEVNEGWFDRHKISAGDQLHPLNMSWDQLLALLTAN